MKFYILLHVCELEGDFMRAFKKNFRGTTKKLGKLFDLCISYSSSLPEVFYEKGVLENFSKFTGKRLCHSPFIIKLQAEACHFIKRDSDTGVFL